MRWQIPAGLSCLLPVVLAILVACLIPRHINKALRGGIADEIVWSENSSADTYARYARDDHDSDPVIHSDFYVLNITNLASVKAGCRPELQQLGPYTYRKHTVKHNIWFDKKGRVAFTRDEFYTALSSNATQFSLDDVITTVNIPLLGALAKAHSFFGRVVALQLLLEVLAAFHDPNVDGLFMTRTVRELLWGYEDPLLQKLKFIAPGLDTRFQLVPNTTASSLHPSSQDIINTGMSNISNVWNTEVWSNHSSIKSWKPPHVEPVQGSDGVQFRPGLKSGDKVNVWAPEVYKSATLITNTTVDLDGVNLLRFRPDLAQGSPNPTYFQTYQGLMNITSPTAAGQSSSSTADYLSMQCEALCTDSCPCLHFKSCCYSDLRCMCISWCYLYSCNKHGQPVITSIELDCFCLQPCLVLLHIRFWCMIVASHLHISCLQHSQDIT